MCSWKACDADEARLAAGLNFAHGWQGLLEDLLCIAKLHIMNLKQVHSVRAQTSEAAVDICQYALGTKIEPVLVVAAALGGEYDFVSASFQGPAQALLCEGSSVVRRYVDEGNPLIDGAVNSPQRILIAYISVFVTKSRTPETKH